MKQEVFCTLQIEGIHRWANCPFQEVDYLRDPHRHVFWIKAFKEVNHDDRDVEFIMLKHEMEQYLWDLFYSSTLKLHDFGGYSCEWIAANLIERFDLLRCEVSEDNENGAIVYAESK
jgi:hypothetical protein